MTQIEEVRKIEWEERILNLCRKALPIVLILWCLAAAVRVALLILG